jgi:hypothetical protein
LERIQGFEPLPALDRQISYIDSIEVCFSISKTRLLFPQNNRSDC